MRDIALGWCWLPVAVLARSLEGNVDAVHRLIGVIFLVSFAHQPLTLGLVYADPVQRGAHRRIYRWAPLAAAGIVLIGLHVSLTAVAVMAGLWNAEHTLMQRYGLMRIYGRKAGDDHGRLEKPMLIAWLVASLTFIAGYVDLDRMIAKLGFGTTNATAVHSLDVLHPVARIAFWCAVVTSVVLTARWWRAERATGSTVGSALCAPKSIYTLGTLGLVAMVMIDPIAGIAGYVAAHSIEYFAIVHTSLRTRTDDAPVARAARNPRRRVVLYGLYLTAIVAVIRVTWTPLDGKIYAFAVLFLGALHIFYDGFVWKLRRPAVAASLGITEP